MTINNAILKSLEDLLVASTSIEIYDHIVMNDYCDFSNAKTPKETVSARLGDFIRNEDGRVKRMKEAGGSYTYYLAKYEQNVVGIDNQNVKDEILNTNTNVKPFNMLLKKPAVKVKQGDLTIYATSLKVKDLLIPHFFLVDKLDASNESSGFQRVLDTTRTKRLADYILKAWEDKDAFLPTSIFLATDKDVFFDEEKNEITFEIEKVCPFNVVDGQHRVQGLMEAAKHNPEIQEFELIANIAVKLDIVTQMCHFLIVNTTQKAVNKAVEQQIISRLSRMVGFEETPTLPRWIQNQVNKGEDRDALGITYYLNTEVDSPWFQKIKMANKPKDDETTINQESFVKSIKAHILSSNNGLSGLTNQDDRNKILKNYWKAIEDLLVDKDSNKETVIFKTMGLELFNIISSTVYAKLAPEENFTVARIRQVLSHGLNNLSNDFIEVSSSEWWISGGGVKDYNQSYSRQIATDLNRAINVQTSSGNLKL